MLTNYPTTFAFVQIHCEDPYATTWGCARRSFYTNFGGYPTSYFDGTIQREGAWPYSIYLLDYNTRQAVTTDVTIDLTGVPVSGQTYDITARACIEAGGTGKTMRIYMVQVLDYWPTYGGYHRNGLKQAATTQDVTLAAGGCQNVVRSFTFDDDSWGSQSNIVIIAWAQEPQATSPPTDRANVFQAAIMHWPFPAGAETNPPQPSPMTWEAVPAPVSTTAVTMTATEATDETPPVQYYFDTSPSGVGHARDWGTERTYTDTGLTPNTGYAYLVRARDSVAPPNNGAWSTTNSTATHIETPTGLTSGTITDNSIEVFADGTLTNLMVGSSGLYFECVEAGTNSGWIQAATWNAGGLASGTPYTFEVKARNQNGVETESVEAVFSTSGVACARIGDMNGDTLVNGLDVPGFVRAKLGVPLLGDNPACADYGGTLEQDLASFISDLLGACSLIGDVNGDMLVNGLDVPGFVRVKLGAPLPEDNPACANYGGTLDEDIAEFLADLLGA